MVPRSLCGVWTLLLTHFCNYMSDLCLELHTSLVFVSFGGPGRGREHCPRVADGPSWPWMNSCPEPSMENRGEDICTPRRFFLQEAKLLGQKRSACQDPTEEGAWGMYGQAVVSGRIGDLS